MYYRYRFHFVVFHHDGSVVSYLVPMMAAPRGGALFVFPPSAPLCARAARCLSVLGAAAVVVCKAFASGGFLPVAAFRGGDDGGCVWAASRVGGRPAAAVAALLGSACSVGRSCVGRRVALSACGVAGSGLSAFVSSLPVVAPFSPSAPVSSLASVRAAVAACVAGAVAPAPAAPAPVPAPAPAAPAAAPVPAPAPAPAPVARAARAVAFSSLCRSVLSALRRACPSWFARRGASVSLGLPSVWAPVWVWCLVSSAGVLS